MLISSDNKQEAVEMASAYKAVEMASAYKNQSFSAD